MARVFATRVVLVTALSVLAASCAGDARPSRVTETKNALEAGAYVLSGTVFGGGSPLPGTTVAALENGTTNVLASNVTDSAGHYALNLDAGTYDLRLEPPAASGLSEQMVQDVAISGDRVYDVILISAAAGVQGTVVGYAGAAVPDATVVAYDSATGVAVASTATDAAGAYSLNIGSGTYAFRVYRYGSEQTAEAPRQFNLYRNNIAISGATTLNLDLQVVRVSGQVTDSNGAPVPNVSTAASFNFYDGSESRDGVSSAASNANGHYELLVLAGTTSFTITPPSDSGYAVLLVSGVAISDDETRDFMLTASQPVTGTVVGYAGAAVPDATVVAYDSATGVAVASTATDAAGAYSLNIGSGTYAFRVYRYGSEQTAEAPRQFNLYRNNIAISGATTLNLDLQVVRVSGQVTDSNGAPVPNVSTAASFNFYDGSESRDGVSSAASNANGHYELLVLAGTTSFTITPPSDSGYAVLLVSGVAISDDETRDFMLTASQPVTGTVVGYAGAAVPDATVVAYDSATGVAVASTATDAAGAYSLNIGSGTYAFRVYRYGSEQTAEAPRQFNLYRNNIAISGATTLNLDLQVVRVSGQVTDSNGAPVPNVSTAASFNFYDGSESRDGVSSAASNANGHYELLVLAGTTSFTITPPASSGFATTLISSVGLDSDRSQAVILQHPDLSPPVIVAGPLVIHLSDTSVSINWTTNEAATSRLDYGIGSLTTSVNQNGLTTDHAVTLVNLQPSTIFTYQVSSVDAAGNGPTQSNLATFRTQDPPGDITPPVITSGPSITFVDDTNAIVAWQTDEPSSSVVNYGTTSGLGSSQAGPSGVFVRDHSIKIAGLSPSTPYFARVQSTDPDGNGPTASAIVQFNTLAAPDTTPPVIVSGPTITAVSDDSISVSWTTDEPSTSGVSYNDGTQFDLVGDSALVTLHAITLSSLIPGTTYELTVSSTDPVGNGPTLGGPINASTTAAPDETAPVISGLTIASVTQTSAVVSWSTDEAATSVVHYGKVAGALDSVRADVAFVTGHQMLLTGLVPGQTYHVAVSSSDTSGNPASSPEASFTTLPTDTGGGLFVFTGFFQPVDNLPTINTVNAGRAVPVKFSLGGDRGLDVLALGYPKSVTVSCGSNASDAIEQTATAGSSGLSYDPSSDRYTYVWKTDKKWADTCRTFIMKLTDGTEHKANFKFK